MKRRTAARFGFLFAAVLVAWVISCGGGSGGFDGDVNINIGSQGQGIELTGTEMWSMAFTVSYDVEHFGGSFGSLGLNLLDNLPWVTFEPEIDGLGMQAVPLSETMGGIIMLRVAPVEAVDTVCTDGEMYGPFSVILDGEYQPMSVVPSSANATTTTLDIINIGAYSVCVQVVSPVDAVAGLDRVGFNATQCADAPAAIAGTWTGPFSCGGNCAYTGTVTLVITQDTGDPSIASYTDSSGGSYEGNICGSRFSFRGGGEGYKESGTFVMDPGGETATKTSTYRELFPGTCYGTCTDSLTRAVL